jgi:hypothetical protein
MKISIKEPKIVFCIGVITLFLLTYFLIFLVPTNMDEFLPYHRLACTKYPAAIEHVFRESCKLYPGELFGWGFFRSYSYVGISSSYLYKPFFNIWPEVTSHYFLGFMVLLFFSIGMTMAMKLKPLVILIPILYFPLLFQTIHDTGPIRIGLLAYPLLILMVAKLLSPTTSIFLKTLSVLAIFFISAVALEDKPFFVYLLPQIIFIAYVNFFYVENKDKLMSCKKLRDLIWSKRFYIRSIFVLTPLLLSLYVVLFCIRIPSIDYQSYFHYLIGVTDRTRSFSDEIAHIIEYQFSPIMFGSRFYEIDFNQKIISTIVFSPILYILLLKIKQVNFPVKHWFLSALILLATIFIFMRNAWTGHHFVFLHIPIIFLLMIYSNKSKEKYSAVLGILIIISLISAIQLINSKATNGSEDNKADVFKYLQNEELAKNSIINFSSWGGYYIQSLYGPESQLVTYTEPINESDGLALESLRQRLKRRYILNVCNSCSIDEISAIYSGSNIVQVGPKLSGWTIFQISK